MLIFLLLTSSLLFVPPAKAYFLQTTGIGVKGRLKKALAQPEIAAITPSTIIMGLTQDVEIVGRHLLKGGGPEVSIKTESGTTVFPIQGRGDEKLIVRVSTMGGELAQEH